MCPSLKAPPRAGWLARGPKIPQGQRFGTKPSAAGRDGTGGLFVPPGEGEICWGLHRSVAQPLLPPSTAGWGQPSSHHPLPVPTPYSSWSTTSPARKNKPSRSRWGRRVYKGGAFRGLSQAVLSPPPPRGWRRGVGSGAAGARPARRGDPWHGFRARRRRASCASVCSPGTARADVLKTPGTQ